MQNNHGNNTRSKMSGAELVDLNQQALRGFREEADPLREGT